MELTSSSTKRAAQLARLPIGLAGRSMVGFGRRLAGADNATVTAELQAKTAEQIFSIVSELKGGAMKVGQALSVMESAVPPAYAAPYREALAKLQNEASPMPAATVTQVLDQQLGTRWRERFLEFDEVAAASASIGQVHRGVWSDGRPVAVKIQYPGADEALVADLKTLRRIGGLLSAFAGGTDVKAIINELSERTLGELDYRAEADNQRRFAQVFADDENVRIPAVVASAPKVVVSEWVDGVGLRRVIESGSRAEQDRAARLLIEFELSSPRRVGLLHGDPHPGNFMIAEDGRLVVLDFGAVAELPDGFPAAVGRILRLARDRRHDDLLIELAAAGFVPKGAKVTADEVTAFLAPFVDPLYTDEFTFTRRWLQRAAGKATDITSAEYRTSHRLSAPPEYTMLFRVLLGFIGISAQMEASAPFRRLVEKWTDPEPDDRG
ncbi:ABC1 kinase family protein [Gordonia sp. CPCC 205333]|uniref:ABC1 kinase family protein n=1 Tax=Gordonia sp. CPCC 205333 TaxID=3140790 RepID=UPI003AF35AC0